MRDARRLVDKLLLAATAPNQGAEHLDSAARDHLRDASVSATELVDGTARPAAMNLLLHRICRPDGYSLVNGGAASTSDQGRRWSVVLATTLGRQVVSDPGRGRRAG